MSKNEQLLTDARAGDAEAMYRLGCMAADERDGDEAKRWWTAAHERGHAQSAFELGRGFLDGTFGAPEVDTGVVLLLAALHANVTAAGELLLERKAAIESAAGAGDPAALCAVGLIELYAFASSEKAVAALDAAADRGNVRAMTTLAWCFVTGQGVPVHDETAIEYYRRAAKFGEVLDCYDTGVTMLNGGRSLPRDAARSIPFFRAALEAGYRKAALGLAVAFARRDRDVRDIAAAAACAAAYIAEANDDEFSIGPESGRWSVSVKNGGRTVALIGLDAGEIPGFAEIASAAAAGKALPVLPFVAAAC